MSYSQMTTLSSTLPSRQQGMSVGGIVYIVVSIVIFVKLGLAIVPAWVGDYQLDKAIAEAIQKANNNKETSQQFLSNLATQLSINADYTTKPAEILTFTNDKPGTLAVRKDYTVVNNFFAHVDIVNHFRSDISANGTIKRIATPQTKQ